MKLLPFDIGKIHFVGIGGIGMSGIAEVMHNLGYKVQGSDAAEGANVVRLRGLGVPVTLGHAAENLDDARVVVVSSAVTSENAEVAAARANFIPVVRRAEMLAELMRFKWSIAVGGTHGKTTTTSMIGAFLDAAAFDPTVINGGIINAYGSNTRVGDGEWMVVEADESDGTFVKLPATIAVLTNMDPEHLDFYGDFDTERRAFQAFVENIPFYGFVAMCIDHPEVHALCGRISDRKLITYGFNPQADVRAENVRVTEAGSHYDVIIADRPRGASRTIAGVHLSMPGRHNIQNSLAAFAVARELGVDGGVVREALAGFEGVRRRFTRTGEAGGIVVIDDYAHHPVEIAAALEAAREVAKSGVIAVVQPHRYSRLAHLFDEFCTCFSDADSVLVAPVYPAGETPIPGADRDALVDGLRQHGHRSAAAFDGPEDLAAAVTALVREGDIVVCMGAGSISAWANALPGQLAEIVPIRRLREPGP
jgi:UDP-N-acetylmuramate--alanine ligase